MLVALVKMWMCVVALFIVAIIKLNEDDDDDD